jgi:hypothetical protein
MNRMNIRLNLSALKESKWYELLVRFLFGGAITVIAGILAKRYGPVFGGLFVAFPAIFPATATLVEKHEREQKEEHGLSGKTRGRLAAAMCARGTEMGSVGLICFAALVWKLAPIINFAAALFLALIVWFGVSFLAWNLHRLHVFSHR